MRGLLTFCSCADTARGCAPLQSAPARCAPSGLCAAVKDLLAAAAAPCVPHTSALAHPGECLRYSEAPGRYSR
jgi:hypothetical protein